MRGTKRMWLRRFLRIGDMIGKGWTWFWATIGFTGIMLGCMITMVLAAGASAIYHGFHDDRVATNDAIVKAMSEDWCMKTNVPIWHNRVHHEDGPLTWGDLSSVRSACDRRLESDAAMAVQSKVLK